MEQNNDKQQDPGLASKLLKVAAYPLSLLPGYWFANSSLNSRIYENALMHDATSDLRDPTVAEMKKIGRSAVERIKKGEKVHLAKETHAVHSKFNQDLETRLEGLTLKSLPDKWEFLQPFQKKHVLMDGVTATTVALGVLLVIANSKAISNLLNHDEKSEGRAI